MQKGRKIWLTIGFFGLFALVSTTLWIAYPPELTKPTGAVSYPKVPEFSVWKMNRHSAAAAGKEEFQTKDILGAWTLLHFWATWCEPCVEEFPVLIEMAKKYEKTGIRFAALSMDEKAEEVWKLVPSGKDLPRNWIMLWDEEKGVPDQLGSFQYPETYLISPQGDIRYKWVGPQKWLEPVHREILEQAGAFSQARP